MKRVFIILMLLYAPAVFLAQDITPERSAVLESTPVTEKSEVKRIRIAIPDFVLANDPLKMAKGSYNTFVEEIRKNQAFEIIERGECERVLAENGIKDAYCRAGVCLEKLVKGLSADKIVLGMVTKNLGRFSIEISIYDPELKAIKNTDYYRPESFNSVKTETENGARQAAKIILESVKGESKFDETFRKYENRVTKGSDNSGMGYQVGFGGYGGVGLLMNGYNAYASTNYMVGGVLNVRMLKDNKYTFLSFGVAMDEFPLLLPEGTYGQAEDLFAITLFANFNLMPAGFINPYAGLGFGAYLDMVSVNTPASGNMSSMYFFIGANVKAGVEININKTVSLFAEAKLHLVWEPGKSGMFIATHTTYAGGAIFYLF